MYASQDNSLLYITNNYGISWKTTSLGGNVNNGKVNNPPNPPYINCNNLKYYSIIDFHKQKLKDSITKMLQKIKQYNYYSNNKIMDDLLKKETYYEDYNDEEMKDYAKDLVTVLENNNPSTLIGSLVSTDILLDTVYTKLVCSTNNNLDKLINKYKGIELTKAPTNARKNYDKIISDLD